MRNRSVLGLSAALVVLILILVVYFFPLQVLDRVNLLRDRVAGVEKIRADRLDGYERNFCESEQVSPAECTCIGFLHGMGATAETWRKVLSSPRESWKKPVRLVALGLPGHGGSDFPETPIGYSVSAMAVTAGSTLSYLPGCSSWTLVGNDWGAFVAASIVTDGRLKVDRLHLVAPMGLRAPLAAALPELRKGEAPSEGDLATFFERAFYRDPGVPHWMWSAILKRRSKFPLKAILDADPAAYALDGKLSAKPVPMTIVWGSADRILGANEFEAWKKELPRAAVKSLPECGHLPQEECPVALVAVINSAL